MSCTQFEDDLRRYYLGEEDDKPKASEYIKMQTHIRSCPNCSVIAEKLKAIQAAMNGIVRQKASATFYDMLSEKLPKPSPVSIYVTKVKRKVSGVPKFAWITVSAVIVLTVLYTMFKIFFPSFGLPIVYYQGDVDIRRSSDNSGMKKLSGYPELTNGDKLKTDSSSIVVFVVSKETSVRMGENSELRIDYIQRARGEGYSCKINLIEGAVWVSQKESTKFDTQKLQVVTDNAFVEPLGSDFDVSSNDNKTVLRVFNGKVRFYHKNFQDEKSIVDGGHSSLTSSDQPPTSPAEIDTANPGGWEQWNMNIPMLAGNLLEIKAEAVKDKISPPKSYMPFFATPAPSVSPSPSPTPGF